MEQKPLGPIRFDLKEAETDPALSVIFDQAKSAGAVVLDIAADSEAALKNGRVAVRLRGL